MQYEILSDIGKKRAINEDSAAVYLLPDGISLAIIADGMGGHQGGDFASTTATQIFGEKFMDVDHTDWGKEDWVEWLQETVYFVNRMLFNYAENHEEYRGMGTTLEVVLMIGTTCLIAHIGDSRIYLINEEVVQQVTSDHSYVNALLRSGEITEDEAMTHPRRNWIMKALGSERTIEPDFYSLTIQEGTYLLLCTDGLSNALTSAVMQEIVLSNRALHEKTQTLVQLANEDGGEDNITVILLQPSIEKEGVE